MHITGAEPLSTGAWNTGALARICRESPFTEGSRGILSVKERRPPAFPALRRGWVRVKPEIRVKGRVPCGVRGGILK